MDFDFSIKIGLYIQLVVDSYFCTYLVDSTAKQLNGQRLQTVAENGI